jgi:hypothetical protein
MARGFHAMWISGYVIFIHGGQGPQGIGPASVRSDTWFYDVYTRVWKQHTSSVDFLKSHLHVRFATKMYTDLIFEDVERKYRQPPLL